MVIVRVRVMVMVRVRLKCVVYGKYIMLCVDTSR